MSALVKTRFGLNERQAAFVDTYLKTGLTGQSALDVGYSSVADGSRLIRLPHVVAAIHSEIQRRLVSEAAPSSFRTLMKLKDNESTPARVRADIGLQLLKMAGHVVPSRSGDRPQKQLSEMTQAELLDYIERNQVELNRIETELVARAKDVSAQDSAQTGAPGDAKPLDFLD